jgi:phosphohistidine phosphatase SixA
MRLYILQHGEAMLENIDGEGLNDPSRKVDRR